MSLRSESSRPVSDGFVMALLGIVSASRRFDVALATLPETPPEPRVAAPADDTPSANVLHAMLGVIALRAKIGCSLTELGGALRPPAVTGEALDLPFESVPRELLR